MLLCLNFLSVTEVYIMGFKIEIKCSPFTHAFEDTYSHMSPCLFLCKIFVSCSECQTVGCLCCNADISILFTVCVPQVSEQQLNDAISLAVENSKLRKDKSQWSIDGKYLFVHNQDPGWARTSFPLLFMSSSFTFFCTVAMSGSFIT